MNDVTTKLANEANDKAVEIARLKAENAKLRESVKRLMTQRDERLARAEAENAKLRKQLAKARDPQRIGGTADPESFVYAIEQLREFRWQHATNDEEAIPYINNVADAHERENAKLREQVAEACMQLGGAWVRCTELRELVRDMFYAVHPADREKFLNNVAELGVEVEQ